MFVPTVRPVRGNWLASVAGLAVSVPRRALCSFLLNDRLVSIEAAIGFSAPKGIVFVPTVEEAAELAEFLEFQCPEGHCVRSYHQCWL